MMGAQHFDCLQDAVLKSLLSQIESIYDGVEYFTGFGMDDSLIPWCL
jgi:hypothetical protein